MLKHLRAELLLPIMVALVIPAAIVYFTGLGTLDLWQQAPVVRFILPMLGALFIIGGLYLMVMTIRLFMVEEKGTIMPWNPIQRLIVQGIYRHVRNPMISGGICILFGEAILATSLPLMGWFLFFVVVNAVYIPLVEERGLVKRFGEDYETYRRNVPRWIPRLSPWKVDPSERSK